MTAWQKFGLFYAIAALVFGAVFATMKNVKVEIAGRPMPHPRIVAFLGVGLFWWAALVAMIVEPIVRKSDAEAAAAGPADSPGPDSGNPSA